MWLAAAVNTRRMLKELDCNQHYSNNMKVTGGYVNLVCV